LKLNLGCGDKILEGYVNIDLYNPKANLIADATKLDFIENDSVDEIQTIAFFEHINPFKAGDTLVEWKRVLKKGGKLIIEMPDILELCKHFIEGDKKERYHLLNCIYGTTQPEHPHLFGWYPDIISDHLVAVGFKDIKILLAQNYHWGYNFRTEAIK